MNIVLLSGGSGKRLWPLSNDIRSKQFIKLFDIPNHTKSSTLPHNNCDQISPEKESMLQRVYRQIKEVSPSANITIGTSKSQVSSIHNQIGNDVNICVEPCRRDTFPAIALLTSYLSDVKGLSRNESVVVCPVDPYVNNDYFEALTQLDYLAKTQAANLILMGIEPTYPSEKYGYIIPSTKETVTTVNTFKEKPNLETAQKYIEQGALWNGGVFAFQLGYLLDIAHSLIDFTTYEDLLSKYHSIEKISFDYAVVEKEKDIKVARFAGEWKDIGTWNTLTEEMSEPIIGKGVCDTACEDVHIINELNIPIVCMNLQKTIVCASPDGILISEKEHSSYIKPYVDKIEQQIMFAEKSWGSFQILDIEPTSITLKVTLNPNQKMNYHSHEHRDEVWTIISGEGDVIIDGVKKPVKTGDVIHLPAHSKHTIISRFELKLIEVQSGLDITVKDKKIYEFPQ